MRVVPPDLPTASGVHEGLSYVLWAPPGAPRARVVVLHGAGSVKESHYAFARHCRAKGFSAVCFDMRGHGESPGRLDGRALADVGTAAALAGDPDVPLVLRGSSMGGWFALTAGALLDAAAVIAICPAPGPGLARAIREGRFAFEADADALVRLIASQSEERAAAALGERLMLLHAAGDESVPVEVSRELHASAAGSWYVEIPGGHHRTVQHDAELSAYSLRWVDKVLAGV